MVRSVWHTFAGKCERRCVSGSHCKSVGGGPVLLTVRTTFAFFHQQQVWINQGDIILLSLRDFQDDKADVIQKYTADEARNLKAYGELPETAKINETDTFGPGEDDDNIEFDEEEIE